MAQEDEIKKFMARAMNQAAPEEQEERKKMLKKLVVDALSSKKKVDWSTISPPEPSGSKGGGSKPQNRPASANFGSGNAKSYDGPTGVPSSSAPGSAEESSHAPRPVPKQVTKPANRPHSAPESKTKPMPRAIPKAIPKAAPKPGIEKASQVEPKASVHSSTNTTAPKPPAPAPFPFAPPPLSDQLPTEADLTQFQQFMQMAQSMQGPRPFPFANFLKPSKQPDKPAIQPMNMSKEDMELAEKRKLRFQSQSQDAPTKRAKPTISGSSTTASINSASGPAMPVVGTCENLEKQYLRLTSEPKPENVRPKRILKKALPFVLQKFENEKKYSYIVSQMKSIRQDLNVQGIRDGFTVTVYESNARIALQNRDLGEFNQCLSRLSELYQDPKLSYTLTGTSGEFLSYHIYYILYTQAYQDLDIMLNKIQSNAVLRQSPQIEATLLVVDAFMTQNSPAMFALFNRANSLTQIAMENVVRRERIRCLAALSKARKKSLIPFAEVKTTLGFVTQEETEEFVKSLTKHIIDDEIECKDAYADFERAWSQATRSKIDIKGQI